LGASAMANPLDARQIAAVRTAERLNIVSLLPKNRKFIPEQDFKDY
jgi:hypothetical protein